MLDSAFPNLLQNAVEHNDKDLARASVSPSVEGYGGEVWVEDNDSEGAVFVVQLPVAEEF